MAALTRRNSVNYPMHTKVPDHLWVAIFFSSDVFKTNFNGISRANIPPVTSICEHLHHGVGEVVIILNAPAQFTVNGKTSELPARSMIVCTLTNSHGIYNHNTDIDLNWLYFAITKVKGNA